MRLLRAASLVLIISVGVVGCRKPANRTSTTELTSASAVAAPTAAAPAAAEPPPKAFVPSHKVPPFKGAFPHRPEPIADVTGRTVSVRFMRNGKDGVADEAPVFALTNLTKERVAVGQTWIYYYDEKKKKLDSYPHSLGESFELAPGETKEKRLGMTLEKIPKETSFIEGEVSSARVGDHEWRNENLVELNSRPQGGLDAQALADRAGERVIVDVYSLGAKRVRLTNVTDHPVKSVDIRFHYGDAKGEIDSQWFFWQKLEHDLAPGQSIDFVAKHSSDRKTEPTPKGAVKVVAFATEVEFSDGTPKFKNENLSRSGAWAAWAPAKR